MVGTARLRLIVRSFLDAPQGWQLPPGTKTGKSKVHTQVPGYLRCEAVGRGAKLMATSKRRWCPSLPREVRRARDQNKSKQTRFMDSEHGPADETEPPNFLLWRFYGFGRPGATWWSSVKSHRQVVLANWRSGPEKLQHNNAELQPPEAAGSSGSSRPSYPSQPFSVCRRRRPPHHRPYPGLDAARPFSRNAQWACQFQISPSPCPSSVVAMTSTGLCFRRWQLLSRW